MSFQAVTWAIEQKAGGPSAKATLWSIANYANEHWCAWPSQSTICRESEQSADSVQRRIPELEAQELIRRIPLRFEGRKSVDFFILRPSRFFTADISQIIPLLPRGHRVYVDCTKFDAAANSGITQPQAQPQPAANAAAACGNKKSLLGTIEPASSFARAHSLDAASIADRIAEIAGIDDAKHGKWFQVGPATIVQQFLNAGYLPEHLIDGAKRGMATLSSPPRDIRYFKPIWQRVRGEAEQVAPGPIAPETQQRSRSSARPGSREDRQERTANARRKLREFAYGFDTDGRAAGGQDGGPVSGGLPVPKPYRP